MTEKIKMPLSFDRSLNELTYDYLGSLLLQRETDALLKEIEQDEADGKTGDMDAFFARQEKQHRKKINQFFLRRYAKSFLTSTLPKLAKVAVLVFAILIVVAGIAVASNSTVRRNVMRFVGEFFGDHISFTIKEDTEASLDVPADWQQNYFPSWTPEHCILDRITSFYGFGSVSFLNKETGNEAFSFREIWPSASDGGCEISLQNAEHSKIEINGFEADLVQSEDIIHLLWSNGTICFEVDAKEQSLEDTLRFASSVRLIKMP